MRGRRAAFGLSLGMMLAPALAPGAAAAAPDMEALFERAGVAPSERTLEAPDFALPDLSGDTVRLSDYAGRVVLLNFWATWCRPCVKEMPALERLEARMKDRGLTVLAVSLDMVEAREVAVFVQGYGWGLPVLLDPLTEVGDAYGIRVMPTTYLIGRDGTILGRSFGAREWDGAEAAALMESLLRAPEPVAKLGVSP
jgi:peroxiredoxin